ncbi:MAG: type II secretion system F family protein [Candidatus Pacebacteria bacterium]|nr:type II secretion system F family protein [Candidatus Paceibacterota bacterium]
MKFKYSARTKSGEMQVGFIEAANKEAASNILIGHDLYILSLGSAELEKWYDRIFNIFKRVGKVDVMVFTRQFATLLNAGIPLGDTLKSLYKQTRNPLLKEAVYEISSDVDSGLSLSQALERHVGIFSEFYVNMMRSAEITGRMGEVSGFMADYLEKETTLLSKVKNALIYPAVVLGLLGIVVGIMVGFVFPQIQPIFEETNVDIPTVTKILLGTGNFIAQWWLAILVIGLIIIVVLVDYFRTKEGETVMDEISIKVPVLGNLFKKMYVARFAESTSVLIKGGIPIAQALEISGHTIGSIVYRDAIHEVAESVREGELLSQALAKKENYFPILVSQMVAVGESTGKLDSLLDRIATFYTREVDDLLSNLVELIQPILMVIIGVGVGLLFAAVLLPIYSLVQKF